MVMMKSIRFSKKDGSKPQTKPFTPTIKEKIKEFFRDNRIIQFCLNIDFDWFFVFLTTYITLELLWWQRLFLAIGITVIYKMIIRDLTMLKVAR